MQELRRKAAVVGGAKQSAATKPDKPKDLGKGEPSATSKKLANTCSPVSTQSGIVPPMKKIEQFNFEAPEWKDAQELKSVWSGNERDIATAATAAMDKHSDLYIYLAKAHAILSQRGDKYAKMRDEAGLADKNGKRLTWTAYFAQFQSKYNFEKCLRVVQYKLAEMAGKKRLQKKTAPKMQLTAADKRKLVDSALESHQVIEAFRSGRDLTDAIKEMQNSLPPKDKLLDLVDNAPRLLKSDIGASVSKRTMRANRCAAGLDWNNPDLQADVLGILIEVSIQILQGDLANKVRALIKELSGPSTTTMPAAQAVSKSKTNEVKEVHSELGGTMTSCSAGQAVTIDDQKSIESVMICVAQQKSVDPDPLAKYEAWLALKGDTERAISLREELRVWKDAMANKACDPASSGAPVATITIASLPIAA